jgi:hypothetical protein
MFSVPPATAKDDNCIGLEIVTNRRRTGNPGRLPNTLGQDVPCHSSGLDVEGGPEVRT